MEINSSPRPPEPGAEVDTPANPLHKRGYRLEFNDEFHDTSLDNRKWYPYYLPQWSSRERAAARYSTPGKLLNLHIQEDQPVNGYR